MNFFKYYFFILLVLLVTKAKLVVAQTEMPFRGSQTELLVDTLEDNNKGTSYLWREKDSVWTIFISKSNPLVYKLLNMREQVLVEGTLASYLDGGTLLVKHGKWTEYYANGNIKSVGYYAANQPVGYWQYNHPNGRKRVSYQYTEFEYDGRLYQLASGVFEEFYANEQLKIMGNYKIVVSPKEIEQFNPATNKKEIITVEIPHSVKVGTWYYYRFNGELFKEEKH